MATLTRFPATDVLKETSSACPVFEDPAAYRNPAILERYIRDYRKTPEEAEVCFAKLKEYLGRAVVAVEPLSPPSRDVDDLWHTFLLFTRDYAAFCQSSFGKFIHHVPKVSPQGSCSGETCNQCDGDS